MGRRAEKKAKVQLSSKKILRTKQKDNEKHDECIIEKQLITTSQFKTKKISFYDSCCKVCGVIEMPTS